jgi:hypothetical protein
LRFRIALTGLAFSSAHPGESRDPGITLRLALPWGCSPKSEQALKSALGPGFRRDERLKKPVQ